MFKVTRERRTVWKNLLLLKDVAVDDPELVCCRHFSLAQYNHLRLQRGCTFNILLPGASPDMYLPGQENPPGVLIYQEG
jgi:hypothetical protein